MTKKLFYHRGILDDGDKLHRILAITRRTVVEINVKNCASAADATCSESQEAVRPPHKMLALFLVRVLSVSAVCGSVRTLRWNEIS